MIVLTPGGCIVYSVCSLEPEEGEAIVAAFLDRNRDFAASAGDLPAFATPSLQCTYRLLPGLLEDRGGLDGFFMARLVRQG